MKNATCEKATYVESISIQVQGNKSKIRKYLEDGYYVQENRNGYWLLLKPAKLIGVLKSEDGIQVFNMKEDVCDFYGKQRISKKLAETFCEEALNGKIKFQMEKGNYSMERA